MSSKPLKSMQEFTVEAEKEFRSIKVQAKNYADAVKKAGIRVRKGTGKVGRPSIYDWGD